MEIQHFNDDITRLLLDAYLKVLRVNLTDANYDEIKLSHVEASARYGYSHDIFKWLENFALMGNVYTDDLADYMRFIKKDRILAEFERGMERISLKYRRRNNDNEFRWVRMALRKSGDYTPEHQVAMLYIEDIHDEVIARQVYADQQQEISDQQQEISDQRQEISDQQQEISDQRQEISDQRQEISDQKLELAGQRHEIAEQKGITDALVDVYFTCLFVDMNDNSYRRIHVSDDFEPWVPESGNMVDTMNTYIDKLVVPNQAQTFMENFSVDAIREKLSGQNSYDYEYEATTARNNMWCRICAILVDKNADGTPHHIVLAMQDVTTQAESVAHTNALLKDAFSSAVAANSAKLDFMSRMSHDIRTPLNGIIGMTAIAGVHLDDRDKVADCLSKITNAGRHLLSLINDILDLSKIESGKLSLTDSDFNLPELLDELLNMVHAGIEERGHELNVYVNNVTHEDVVGDDIRLQQVFTNIVSNAIKYTPNGGRINIHFSELPSGSTHIGRYRFVCEDNGYGMSEEFLQKIFEPFERADGSATAKTQGTGLGMTIARNIVGMMGGTIGVESREGVGTRFTVDFKMKLQENNELVAQELRDLPVLVVDDDEVTCESANIALQELGMRCDYTLSGEDAVEMVRSAHDTGSDYFACLIDWQMPGIDGIETTRRIRRIVGPDVSIIIISAFEWVDIEEEARAAGADGFITKPLFKSRLRAAFTEIPKSLKSAESEHLLDDFSQRNYAGKRLLLVEDNDLNREIATEILRMTEAEVETAEDGKVATEMFAASEPGYYDMVFMDVRMPVMDGYEATRTIRAMEREDAASVPIVALTANAFMEDIEQAHRAGMNKHMAKPIDLDKLLDVMEECLG